MPNRTDHHARTADVDAVTLPELLAALEGRPGDPDRVESLDADATFADLVALARRTGFARFPVHDRDPDAVLERDRAGTSELRRPGPGRTGRSSDLHALAITTVVVARRSASIRLAVRDAGGHGTDLVAVRALVEQAGPVAGTASGGRGLR